MRRTFSKALHINKAEWTVRIKHPAVLKSGLILTHSHSSHPLPFLRVLQLRFRYLVDEIRA